MSGMLEDRVDGDLVAMDDIEDAVRHAGLGEELGQEVRGRRILLRRLEDECVALAIAVANIHIGTIAGKLNGVIPATTPSGWRI